ncbi:MAG: response regulator, partial [Bacteroidota bacterium]
IFERFRQGSELLTRNNEGSGLGLAIAKAYVELLGGEIRVESEEGMGTEFYFTIPFTPVQETDIAALVDNVPMRKEAKHGKLKILIAEDDEVSEQYVTMAIKDYTKEMLIVKTGFEAVEVCRNNPDIDLILMDIRMLVMDGYAATRQIREFNKDVIIIAQTAQALSGERETALDAGCNDYISKPINQPDLMRLIEKYFRG